MLQAYRDHTTERELEGIPPKPLDAQQVADLVVLLKNPPAGEENHMLVDGFLIKTNYENPPPTDLVEQSACPTTALRLADQHAAGAYQGASK